LNADLRGAVRALLASLSLLVLAAKLEAGGGPERSLLVVNARSPLSLKTANFYRAARGIPDTHVVYLDQVPGDSIAGHTAMSLAEYQGWVLDPILDFIEENDLQNEIDLIVYSSGFPYCVDLQELTKAHSQPTMITPTASLTGLTYFAHASLRSGVGFLQLDANKYFRGGIPLQGKSLAPMNEWEQAYHQKGRKAYDAKNHPEAVEHLRKLTASYRDDGTVWYNLACSESLSGNYFEAIEALTKAVANGWSHAFYTQIDEDLISLRHRQEFTDLLAKMRARAPRILEPHELRTSYLWTGEEQPVRAPLREAILSDQGGYYLSAMLAYYGIRGNTIGESLRALESSCHCDGSRPDASVYLMQSDDIRSRSRELLFAPAREKLMDRGKKVEILRQDVAEQDGIVPRGKRDIIGAVVGAKEFNWDSAQSSLVPGAIAEHFTSFGAAFWDSRETKVSEWVRAGVAATTGTVAEPWALSEKFPTPLLHVAYADGCSAAEAVYQSVSCPYELLMLGDPLARPFATFVGLDVVSPSLAEPWRGPVEILVNVVQDSSTKVGLLELWVDGLQVSECTVGERLKLDTRSLEDGEHEIRVIAQESSRVATRSSRTIAANFNNNDHRVELTVPGKSVLGDPVQCSAAAQGATLVEIRRGTQVLVALESKGSGSWTGTLDSRVLGPGISRLHARAGFKDGRAARSSAWTIDVSEPKEVAGLPEPGYALPGASVEVRVEDRARKLAFSSFDPWVAVSLREIYGESSTPARVEVKGELRVEKPGLHELMAFANLPLTWEIDKGPMLKIDPSAGPSRFMAARLSKGWHPFRASIEGLLGQISMQLFHSGADVGHFVGGEFLQMPIAGTRRLPDRPQIKLRGVYAEPKIWDEERGGEGQMLPGLEMLLLWKTSQRDLCGVVLFFDSTPLASSFPLEWVVERGSEGTGFEKCSNLQTLPCWQPSRGPIEQQTPSWLWIGFDPTNARQLRVRPREERAGDFPKITEIEALVRTKKPR